MKPSTKARIDRIVSKVSCHLSPGQAAALREIVEYEITGQDRDTRHACAEAINEIGTGDALMIGTSSRIVLDAFKQTASQACINVQAI